MNDLVTDIKALKEETLKIYKVQETTIQQTISPILKILDYFIVQNGFKTRPSDPKTSIFYLTHLSTKEVKLSTIKRRLVSIGVIRQD